MTLHVFMLRLRKFSSLVGYVDVNNILNGFPFQYQTNQLIPKEVLTKLADPELFTNTMIES